MALFHSKGIGNNLREFKDTALEIRNKWSQVGNRYKTFNDDIQRRKNTFSAFSGTQRQLLNVNAVEKTIPEWLRRMFNDILIISDNQNAEQAYQNLCNIWSKLDTDLIIFISSPQLTLNIFTEYYQQNISTPILKINEFCDLIEKLIKKFKENVESDLRMLSNVIGIVDIYQGTELEENFRKDLDEIKLMLEKLKDSIDLILKMINKIKKMLSKSLKAYFDYVRQKLSEDDSSSAIQYLSKIEKMLRTYRTHFLSS